MGADIPDGWTDELANFVRTLPEDARRSRHDADARTRIWVGRTVGLGAMSAEEAVNYGLSGPDAARVAASPTTCARTSRTSTTRRTTSTSRSGTNGDVYDRYLVRMEEMRQSMRILEQALERLPDGPVNVDDHRVILPPKTQGDERHGDR